MTIEYMYPEFATLYGDTGNIKYLEKSLPNAKIIKTYYHDEPKFLNEQVDLVYFGSMTEQTQNLVIDKLVEHKEKIKELIENGQCFLCTGSSMAMFGEYILLDNKKTNALNIFPFYSSGDTDIPRHNYMFAGEFEDMTIIGHKSQFLLSFGTFEFPFMKVIKGIGNSLEDPVEGIHYKNFFATSILGPLLVMNPLFTKHLLATFNITTKLAFEEDVVKAYEKRLSQMLAPNAYINIGEHGC